MDNRDWTGNSKAVFAPLGASNHSAYEREQNDFYATDPVAAEWLLKLESLADDIWEPACGEGHLAKVFEAAGRRVLATDKYYRSYGASGIDFLKLPKETWRGDIVTNPPYKYAQEFIEKSLQMTADGAKICMFLKVQFLESKARRKLFDENPPKRVWISSSRLHCAMNGDFEKHAGANAIAYAWYVWEKGWHGDTVLKWFN